jgi:hypothetical protein
MWHQIARICLSNRSSNAAPATTTVRLKKKKKFEVEVEDKFKKHQLKDDNNNKNRAFRYQVARICLSAYWRRRQRDK